MRYVYYSQYRDMIIRAINEQKILVFDYRDDKGYITRGRIVEPYVLIPKGDPPHLNLNARQTGGSSRSRRPPFWNDFHLDAMSNIVCLEDQKFEVHYTYDENAEKYKNAIAKVHRYR